MNLADNLFLVDTFLLFFQCLLKAFFKQGQFRNYICNCIHEGVLWWILWSCLYTNNEFVLKWMWILVARKQYMRIFQQLAVKEPTRKYIEFKYRLRLICKCKWTNKPALIGFTVFDCTYLRIILPSVWSSLLTVNIAAFVTLVSSSLTILKTKKIAEFRLGSGGHKRVSYILFSKKRTYFFSPSCNKKDSKVGGAFIFRVYFVELDEQIKFAVAAEYIATTDYRK